MRRLPACEPLAVTGQPQLPGCCPAGAHPAGAWHHHRLRRRPTSPLATSLRSAAMGVPLAGRRVALSTAKIRPGPCRECHGRTGEAQRAVVRVATDMSASSHCIPSPIRDSRTVPHSQARLPGRFLQSGNTQQRRPNALRSRARRPVSRKHDCRPAWNTPSSLARQSASGRAVGWLKPHPEPGDDASRQAPGSPTK